MLEIEKTSSAGIWAICLSSIAFVVSNFMIFRSRRSSNCDCSQKTPRPEKWVKVGTVKSLIIYPIKSCAGIMLEKGILTKLGLQRVKGNIRDRDFMLVDDTGKMVTMGRCPRMSLIHMDIGDNDEITLRAPDMPSLTFTRPEANEKNARVCKFRQDLNVKALDCGDEVCNWFQKFLETSTYRLYYHYLNYTQRTLEKYMYDCPQFEQTDMGTFQNETSYMLVSQESIDDLNQRLEKDSTWRNWRPTILIDEVNEPFAEVNWSFVKVGNQNGILKASVPCKRCPITTVDQDAGLLSKDGEPLKTLREMKIGEDRVTDKRLHDVLKNKGIMGIRLGLYLPAGEGATVSVGDPVYAALL